MIPGSRSPFALQNGLLRLKHLCQNSQIFRIFEGSSFLANCCGLIIRLEAGQRFELLLFVGSGREHRGECCAWPKPSFQQP